MAATYVAIAQEANNRNDGASSPTSASPALSSSPMPLLRSADTTFTPVSMDSRSYLDHGVEGKFADASLHDDPERSISQTATATTDAVDLPQSVTASARATAAMEPRPTKTEYDLLLPSPGAVDTASSGPSSPSSNIDNTRSRAADLQNKTVASPTSTNTFPPIEHGNNVHHPTIFKPTPILRTASTKSVKLIHPSPSLRSRSSSHASNVAQLEATAEKLSMTSSIEDAIRDLHEEQKRSDSRRSSILAASTGLGPDYKEQFPFTRQVSGPSSILDTNNAARHGGYSPAGYVMSPNNSLLSNPSRLRSASNTRSDADSGDLLTRNGPGKSSTRSAKSTTKPSLTDIAEMEPTGLTLAAMDAADRLEEHPEEEETLRAPPLEDVEMTPNADRHNGPNTSDYWGDAVAEVHRDQVQHLRKTPQSPSGSTGTYDQADMAFADFDGAHCSPEAHEDSFPPPFNLDLSLEMPAEHPGRPRISKPTNPTVRPKSYMDPETGQQMMYYPARVPMMLNLPQKLSKKPKADVRNQRRSQVLSAMPEANRQSAAWLPEVLPEPDFDPLGSGSNPDLSTTLPQRDSALEGLLAPQPLDVEVGPQARPNPRSVDEEARKSHMSVMDPADKRKSRMSYTMDKLPPQLRASAFFDMPSESPNIVLKDGSAMATLDSILDASAKAPVSAFTDHAFAGKLGTEVYGHEKRKSHMKRDSSATLLEVKKRSSIFHLRTPSKISIKSSAKDEKRNTPTSARFAGNVDDQSDEEQTRLSGSVDGETNLEADQDDRKSGEDSDEDPANFGAPTTLLAELQIRKRQQKLRTKAPTQLYPGGMHSTLLEIDTVAEMERKNRKGKKVNLAWEGMNSTVDESDDEDVPLGLLAVMKNGHGGVNSFREEMNRPLGLMEKRNLDDNEPLSLRRDRLQGRPTLAPRHTLFALGDRGALGMSGGLGPPSPNLRVHTPEEDETEEETLAERMRRLRARDDGDNPLPQARPVSTSFSNELLSQFGDAFKDDVTSQSSAKGKGKEIAAPPEEQETLGQRRRRLQAEREARDKEMGAGVAPILTKRHSMADVLGATRRTVLTDPRADAERARREEVSRSKKDHDQKLAGFRTQMPNNRSTPNLQPGAYAAGQYSDGTAGGAGRNRVQSNYAAQAHSMQPMAFNGGIGGTMVNGTYGMGGTGGYPVAPNVYGQSALGYNGAPLQMQMLPMPMQQPGQQYDRVDRWRQSIVP